MMRSTTGFVSPQVQQLIRQINAEGTRFDRELRSAHREKMIIPADVVFDSGHTVTGFTRNLSAQGACLLTCEEIEDKVKAVLKLYRVAHPPSSSVFAECRWTKKYCDGFWVSGWQFLQVKPEV